MRTTLMHCRLVVPVVVALATSVWAGCSLENPGIPELTSPSGFGTAVTLSAFPDSLPRNGSAQSVVTVTVRDSANTPAEGQRLVVAADIGTVSQTEIVTNGDGQATFTFVAPAARVPGSGALISVVLIGTGGDVPLPRTMVIGLSGAANATAPTPSFTMSPTAPVLRQSVALDASATTDEGAVCGDLCTYAWDFGGEATGSGRITSYPFLGVRTYQVTLTVTDAQGTASALTQNLVVARGAVPTASFTLSPTSPGQFETVNFTAEASRVGEPGRTIESYEWRFGDGETASGITTTHSYSVLGTYAVVLTVTDSAGIQSTSTQNVTVVNSDSQFRERHHPGLCRAAPSADAEYAQTSGRDAGRPAGERRGGCADTDGTDRDGYSRFPYRFKSATIRS
jgi:PKD repeat protein